MKELGITHLLGVDYCIGDLTLRKGLPLTILPGYPGPQDLYTTSSERYSPSLVLAPWQTVALPVLAWSTV